MNRITTDEFEVTSELGLDGGVSADELQLIEACLDDIFRQVMMRVAMESEE